MEVKRSELEDRLREVEGRLRHEMRARGFDPDQQDNLALTGPLARIYMERENVREQLESLSDVAEDEIVNDRS